jgi:mono/diheme cytochrome c family protein
MKSIFYSVMVIALFLTACGAPQAPSTGAAPVAVATVPTEYAGLSNPFASDGAQAGAELFKINCVSCHGERGRGDGSAGQSLVPPPANLFILNQIAADDYLYWRINTGKPGTAMVGWKGVLTEEQIWQLVSFIRALK